MDNESVEQYAYTTFVINTIIDGNTLNAIFKKQSKPTRCNIYIQKI